MFARGPATPLPRPAPDAAPGPLDDRLYDLVEERFVRLIRDNPVLATAVGLHADDDLLGDGSREQVLTELEADRLHLAEIEAIDPNALSPTARFERDLEIPLYVIAECFQRRDVNDMRGVVEFSFDAETN